ncbi:imidazole glycerol phosphate synthase subunit HisH [Devosia sp. CAU 1758]
MDYGLGNIRAFENIYKRLGLPVVAARTAEVLSQATKIILPGVGAFDWAMSRLNESGMRDTLDDLVLNRKVDVLGVCVGMQMMAKRSDEGQMAGLGWIDANVVRLDVERLNQRTRLPHMGWNDVTTANGQSLFRNIEKPRYYFLHSFVVTANREQDVLARTTYGTSFVSAVASGNVYGTQFHPEKSHQWGIKLLQNFAEA